MQSQFDSRLEVSLAAARLVETEQSRHILIGDGPAIGATGQFGQNLLGTQLFILDASRSTQKNPLPAGGIPASYDLKRSPDGDLAYAGFLQLPDGPDRPNHLFLGPGFLQESHSHRMRTRFHGEADVQTRIGRQCIRANQTIHVDVDRQIRAFTTHLKLGNSLAIQQEVHLVLLHHSENDVGVTPQETNLDGVLAIHREEMGNRHSARP